MTNIVSDNLDYIWTSGRLCDFPGCDRPDLQPVSVNGWFWTGSNKKIAPTNSTPASWDYQPWSPTGEATPDTRHHVIQTLCQDISRFPSQTTLRRTSMEARSRVLVSWTISTRTGSGGVIYQYHFFILIISSGGMTLPAITPSPTCARTLTPSSSMSPPQTRGLSSELDVFHEVWIVQCLTFSA